MTDVDRTDLEHAVAAIPGEQRLGSIRLWGAEVIPRVRTLMADS